MRIVSWNVNGLRAIDRSRRFRRFMERSEASVIAVQESRVELDQLPRRLARPRNWHVYLHSAKRKGYSGVALYSRRAVDTLDGALGEGRFDDEGRFQLARFGRLSVANVYFPNGSGVNRDHSRVPYKLDFYRRIHERLEDERRVGQRVLVLGDFNTALAELDLARPRQNHHTSGFLPDERRELERWLSSGYIDTFRSRCPDGGHYTWWSQRIGVRERNIGWRIDLVLACPDAGAFVRDAFIWPQVRGSDHCPVGVDLDPAIAQ